jgi:hypothetical protein
MPDPTMNLKALTIANGPDIFIMNLWSKTGLHVIDQSPTCFFKAPIVLQAPLFPPSEKEKMVASISFEIGREMTYMEGKGIKPVPGSFRGRDADLYRSDANGLTLTLYTEPKASLPIGVSVFDGKTELVTITYDEYDSNLPADRSLFWPPPGVQLSIKK